MFVLEKRKIDATNYVAPTMGDAIQIPLRSPAAPRDSFILDINRKYKAISIHFEPVFQLRPNANGTVYPLIRLEIDPNARRHQNPDENWIYGPHIHVYVEGCELNWAYPLDMSRLSSFWISSPTAPRFNFPNWDISKTELAWLSFLPWINVTDPPTVDFPLF